MGNRRGESEREKSWGRTHDSAWVLSVGECAVSVKEREQRERASGDTTRSRRCLHSLRTSILDPIVAIFVRANQRGEGSGCGNAKRRRRRSVRPCIPYEATPAAGRLFSNARERQRCLVRNNRRKRGVGARLGRSPSYAYTSNRHGKYTNNSRYTGNDRHAEINRERSSKARAHLKRGEGGGWGRGVHPRTVDRRADRVSVFVLRACAQKRHRTASPPPTTRERARAGEASVRRADEVVMPIATPPFEVLHGKETRTHELASGRHERGRTEAGRTRRSICGEAEVSFLDRVLKTTSRAKQLTWACRHTCRPCTRARPGCPSRTCCR